MCRLSLGSGYVKLVVAAGRWTLQDIAGHWSTALMTIPMRGGLHRAGYMGCLGWDEMRWVGLG